MKENDIDIGKKISNIRKACNMTQEEFGALFHVTRQTVSNWENEKNYPDLKTLIEISDRFSVSLDQILKENPRMVKTIDQERIRGSFKRQKAVTDFLCGAGTGLIIGGLMLHPLRARLLLSSSASDLFLPVPFYNLAIRKGFLLFLMTSPRYDSLQKGKWLFH